jgi:hypothetical protein
MHGLRLIAPHAGISICRVFRCAQCFQATLLGFDVVRSQLLTATMLLALSGVAAGCKAGGSAAPGTAPTINTTTTRTASPQPTKTIIRGFRTLRPGDSETLHGSGGAAMFIKASGPSVSTTRLSPSYGYPPSHGYYVTFRIKIKDVGSTPIIIHRLDFWVKTPGLGRINTNDGTAFVSGSSSQLDTTGRQEADHRLALRIAGPDPDRRRRFLVTLRPPCVQRHRPRLAPPLDKGRMK